MLVLFRATK